MLKGSVARGSVSVSYYCITNHPKHEAENPKHWYRSQVHGSFWLAYRSIVSSGSNRWLCWSWLDSVICTGLAGYTLVSDVQQNQDSSEANGASLTSAELDSAFILNFDILYNTDLLYPFGFFFQIFKYSLS